MMIHLRRGEARIHQRSRGSLDGPPVLTRSPIYPTLGVRRPLLDDNYEQNDSTSTYTYTYYSTWSSNYTMSNLVGPGRLLGKLFSNAGSSLERRLGKLAYRARLGSHAKAETDLSYYNMSPMLHGEDMILKEKACNILLGHARYATSLSSHSVLA